MSRVVTILFAGVWPALVVADDLPPGAILRVGSQRWHASAPIQLTAFRGTTRELVTYSSDGFVTVWDADGKDMRRFDVSAGAANVVRVVASGDGTRLAVVNSTRTVTVWDVDRGTKRQNLGAFLGIWLALAPDGQTLVGIETTGRVVMWNLNEDAPTPITLEPAPGGARRFAHHLAFSRDGKSVLGLMRSAGGDGRPEAIIWDVATRKESRRVAVRPEGTTPDAVLTAFVSPDLAAMLMPRGSALVWFDLAAGKEARTLNNVEHQAASTFRFAGEGKELVQVMGHGEAILVWDVARGQVARRFGQPDDETAERSVPIPMAISADGGTLALADGAVVRLVDLLTGRSRGGDAEGHTTPLLAAYYSPDGQSILTRTERHLIRWEAKTGVFRERFDLPGTHSSFLISRDMKWLIATSPNLSLTVYDLATKKEQRSFSTEALGGYTYTVAPDSRTLLVLSRPATHLKGFDLTTGNRIIELPMPTVNPAKEAAAGTTPRRLTVSRDSRRVAGCTEEFVIVWDLVWQREVQRFPVPEGGGVRHISFGPDGRTLAIEFYGGDVALWEIASGVRRRTLSAAEAPIDPRNAAARLQADGVRLPAALALSADGRLAAGADANRTIHVWDLHTGRELGTFAGHRAAVTGVNFSPDSQRLVSGCSDATALVWDLAPLRARLAPPPKLDGAAQRFATLVQTDGVRAFDAILALAADPDAALPVLREKLRPVPPPDEAAITRYITDLDAAKFTVRIKARRELEKLGEIAAPSLRKAFETSESVEVRSQVRRLLDGLGARRLTPDEILQTRSIEVLERIGTPAARELLTALAKGAPAAPLTAEAAAALARLDDTAP